MTTGIVLIATGDFYYVQLALNLAVSIKVNAPEVLVHLVHDGGYNRLSPKQQTYFNSETFIHTGNAFSLKTQLYELTPYDWTLYLDVDTIILPNADLKAFIYSLEKVAFAIINKLHEKDINIWADPAEIRRVTGNNTFPFYHYFSELIYFEKSDTLANYFNEARLAYTNPGIESRTIAKQIPDELAFIMASMRTEIKPHFADWSPLFWHFRNKKDTGLQMYQLNKKYIGYSIGGNSLPEYVKAVYNNIITFYERKTGLKGLRRSADKRLLFRDRIKI